MFLPLHDIESTLRLLDGTSLKVVDEWCVGSGEWGVADACASAEVEGGVAGGLVVVDVGEGLVHGSTELGDGGGRGGEGKLVVGGAEEVLVGRLVVVAVVGRHYAVAVTGVYVHGIAPPCRLEVGDLGDEQATGRGIAVPPLLTDGLDEVVRGGVGLGDEKNLI